MVYIAGMNLMDHAKMDHASSVVPAIAAGKTGRKIKLETATTKELIQSTTVVCKGQKLSYEQVSRLK